MGDYEEVASCSSCGRKCFAQYNMYREEDECCNYISRNVAYGIAERIEEERFERQREEELLGL